MLSLSEINIICRQHGVWLSESQVEVVRDLYDLYKGNKSIRYGKAQDIYFSGLAVCQKTPDDEWYSVITEKGIEVLREVGLIP